MHSIRNGSAATSPTWADRLKAPPKVSPPSWADRLKKGASADKVAADTLVAERNRAVNEFRATFTNNLVILSPARRHVYEATDNPYLDEGDVVIERQNLDGTPTWALIAAVANSRRCAANLYRRRTMLSDIKQRAGGASYIGMHKDNYGDGVVQGYFTSAINIPEDMFVYCIESLGASDVSTDEVAWVHAAVMKHVK